MMIFWGRLLAVLVVAEVLSASEAWAPPKVDEGFAAVCDMVAASTATGPVRVKYAIFGPADDVDVVSADRKRVTVSQSGSSLPMPWERLKPDQIAAIAAAAARNRPTETLLVVDWLIAGGEPGLASALVMKKTDWTKEDAAAVALRTEWIRGQPDEPEAQTSAAMVATLAEATDCTAAGISRRFGPDWASRHPGEDPAKGFPEVYLAPEKTAPKGRKYQLGTWTKEVGDFSSAQGQVCYLPDAGGMGIDRVTLIRMDNGCFTEKPEVPWWGGWRPEPHSKSWGAQSGGVPLGLARGLGGWSNCAVILFPNGLITTAGTCTAFGSDPVCQLPADKVPTAICVTSRNELALVTVVDRTTGKGQLAVLALTSHKPGFAHDWQAPHPGLPSVAMLSGIKLLGYIDVGMAIPNLVSAAAPSGGRLNSLSSGNIGTLNEFDLSKPAIRASFAEGGNANFVSRAGWAVVGSTCDGKVSFVDLQPVFQRFREMYFTSEANYKKTLDQGPEPKQWPYAFEVDRAMTPKVVKTVTVRGLSALAALRGRSARALLARRDGKVSSWAVGGLGSGEPASSADIGERGSVKVGANPCSISPLRGDSDTAIVVCRGDRELVWVRAVRPEPPRRSGKADPAPEPVAADEVSIVRRLRDARLIDPVSCEQIETHGVSTSLLTVCDFAGRKILNYRFGELVFSTQGGAKFGMGADGKAGFECGGVMEFPGMPFAVCGSNVN